MADKIIIEVNTRIPSFEGLHDISMCSLPPNRKPYLIMSTEDRIGTVSKKLSSSVFVISFYL
jgi:acetyl-CoA hydrolase